MSTTVSNAKRRKTKDVSSAVSQHLVNLNGRIQSADRYTCYFVNGLIAEKIASGKDLVLASEGLFSAIPYKARGKNKEYVPDLAWGDGVNGFPTLIKVESVLTLFMYLEFNKIKALAAVEYGTPVRTVVSYGENNGGLMLPLDWYNLSVNKLQALVRTKQFRHTQIVLGLDPGVANSAWSVVKFDANGGFQVLGVGMLANTVKDFTLGIEHQCLLFLDELKDILRRHPKITAVCAERFMTRGNKGTTIEKIGLMLGMVVGYLQSVNAGIHVSMIPASQWKNEFNRQSDLEAWYQLGQKELTPHEVDAISIALYAGSKLRRLSKPFEGISLAALAKSSKKAQALALSADLGGAKK